MNEQHFELLICYISGLKNPICWRISDECLGGICLLLNPKHDRNRSPSSSCVSDFLEIPYEDGEALYEMESADEKYSTCCEDRGYGRMVEFDNLPLDLQQAVLFDVLYRYRNTGKIDWRRAFQLVLIEV